MSASQSPLGQVESAVREAREFAMFEIQDKAARLIELPERAFGML